MKRPAPARHAGILIILWGALVSGCGHTPTPRYYVLSAPLASASSVRHDGPHIGLGPISLPDYLDRPQIVTRASNSRLDLSNQHRWAEPLSASFARALLANLEQALPGADIALHPWRDSFNVARQVRIDVTRFDRQPDGVFRLSARWTVTTAGAKETTTTQLTDIDIPAKGQADDYDALVDAANGAVAALANAISTQLNLP